MRISDSNFGSTCVSIIRWSGHLVIFQLKMQLMSVYIQHMSFSLLRPFHLVLGKHGWILKLVTTKIIIFTLCHLPPSLKVADSSIGIMRRGRIPLSPTNTEARAANNQGCSSNSSTIVNKYSGKYPAKTELSAADILLFFF